MHKPIYVYGFPSLYGGAGTELHHQIGIWQKLVLDVHIIPTDAGFRWEPLYHEMISAGVTVHEANQFSAIQKDAPIFGFCNAEFLDMLDEIRRYSSNTVFLNCMTWLFDKEKRRMAEGKIRTFLYQNDEVRASHEPILRSFNPEARSNFLTFKPYFDISRFPFISHRSEEYFGCGRISRQDTDKYSRNTLLIYDRFVSPVPKKALFLGFDKRCEEKIGKPYAWIRTAMNQNDCTQQDFYKHCEIVLQPMDTTENWPRVGFEAMASGSVLIVDNRGGWRLQIKHGETGWLCNNEGEFIAYATKMATEPNFRLEMAHKARERGETLGGLEASMESWAKVFEMLL